MDQFTLKFKRSKNHNPVVT